MEVPLIINLILIAAAAIILLRTIKDRENWKKEVKKLSTELDKQKSDTETEWEQIMQAASVCACSGETPYGFIYQKVGDQLSYCSNFVIDMLNWPPELMGFGEKSEEISSRLSSLISVNGDDLNEIAIIRDGATVWVEIKKNQHGDIKLTTVRDITKMVETKQQCVFAEQHDMLTGLYKHTVFLNKLQELFGGGSLGTACMILFELESLNFVSKKYNNCYADEYVKNIAGILKSFYPLNSLFSKYSDSEIYGFMYGYQDEDTLRQAVDSLFEKIGKIVIKIQEDDRGLPLKASAGIAWYPKDSEDISELLAFANFSSYIRQINNAKNYVEFSRELYQKKSYLINSRDTFLQFIEDRFVKYAFQAIVDVSTGKIYGYELLMRPQKPELKSPTVVLNLAKIHSKLHVIENITWFEGMRAYIEQVEKGLISSNTKIFINSIGGVALTDNEMDIFYNKYYNYVNNLVIEITEGEQEDNECISIKRRMAEQWKAMIAIDDFGTGYNGEVSLLYFQPNIIKVDINIIEGIDHDADRLNLLTNIIQYARQRNIRIIAEGVTTGEELKTVIECGVDYVQGFYISMPVFMPMEIPSKIKSEICEYRAAVNV